MWDVLQYDFMRNALIAGLLASLACGVIGTYVVTKRIVFLSGGISHMSFGGIGMGYFFGFSPVLGALLFALASAFGIGLARHRTRLPEDTSIGVMWAVGMALGIVLVGLTPGYAPDLMSYLFGSILAVPTEDLVIMAVLDFAILAVVFLFYKEFLMVSFDEEYAKVSGVKVSLFYALLLALIALTIVILIRVVGIILIIALLAIPASIAKQFTYNLRNMMFIAILTGVLITFAGLWASYELDINSGSTIVLTSGFTMLLVFIIKNIIAGRSSAKSVK